VSHIVRNSLAFALFLAVHPLGAQEPCCRSEALEIVERYRVEGLDSRRFTHEQYWGVLEPVLESERIRVTPLGASVEGRAIRAVAFGSGQTTVLMWSQMHGDESTATMALADLLHWVAASPPDDELRLLLEERLTVVLVPMLNPDGAERFRRENALGVDINRDARRTATPEGRILKSLRDSIRADFGFNLHDQGTHAAGEGGDLVAIALLAPAADEERSWGPVRQRARGVAAVIAAVLEPELSGRLARYDDGWAARAFGDNMQAWGTSTVLIESGVLAGDAQKQELRKLHVVGLLSALHAIATGRVDTEPTAAYDDLPENREIDVHLLVTGGHVVLPGAAPVRADVAIRFDDSSARTGPRIAEIGDLADASAVDTVSADDLFLHLETDDSGAIRRGDPARLEVRRGPEPDSEFVWELRADGEPPE
jgi:hypothetical protein